LLDEGDPETIACIRQTATRLRGALPEVPESQRRAFELLRFEGLTVKVAAERLGVTHATVKTRAHRAYEALLIALDRPGAGARQR
jgi:RNA polymerase sigma-70 factor (ECF subfamily)